MRRIGLYLKYLWFANGRHGVHSPFVYALLEDGLRPKLTTNFSDIEKLRKKIKASNERVSNNFGSNSGVFKGEGKLATLAKVVSIHPKYGRLLYRLVHYFKPEFVVEMGSCLGFSSAYMAKTNTQIISCEGNALFSEKAKSNHQQLGLVQSKFVNKSFDDFIAEDLSKLPFIPFLYLDGDHTYAATIKYFEALLPKANDNAIWIFDDIYWSTGMEQAWEHIKNHESVTLTLDFFKFGVVFFRPMKQKQHFRIWY